MERGGERERGQIGRDRWRERKADRQTETETERSI